MKKLGKPVPEFLKRAEKYARVFKDEKEPFEIDFSNTEVAFELKSDKQLKKAGWLFNLMNKQWLVEIGSSLGLAAIRLRLPFAESIVKHTIFEQFCGGTTLLESTKVIDQLFEKNVLTVLDYGAEAKEKEVDFNHTMKEAIRAIEFAERTESVPVISAKISGMARMELLESVQKGEPFTTETRAEYKIVLKRLDAICHIAGQRKVAVFFDAEESWIQDSIDHLVTVMMRRYNRGKVVVYNTFQLYRKDKLQFLFDSYNLAKQGGYLLGAKLVRGAYLEKERERAQQMNYPSPIQENKAATDDAFNIAIRFCVDHYENLASCNASHNQKSILLQARLIHEKAIIKNHVHLNFCQLYGMSDHLTFNLSKEGFNVAKYMPYGSVKEVIPYLIRRAEENSAVTGDMGREYELVVDELARRGLS